MKVAYLLATLATVVLMRCHPVVAPTCDHESDTTSRGLLLVLSAALASLDRWGRAAGHSAEKASASHPACGSSVWAATQHACCQCMPRLLLAQAFTPAPRMHLISCSSRPCSCCGVSQLSWRRRLWYRSWYWCSAHSMLKGFTLPQPTWPLSGEASLGALRCNHLHDATGIDLNWQMRSGPHSGHACLILPSCPALVCRCYRAMCEHFSGLE